MEFKIIVEDGPWAGKVFHYKGDEPANRLVGRIDEGWEGWEHVERDEFWGVVGDEDDYISRPHFTLEFRPPNCLLRDPASLNGTRVQRCGEGSWQRVEETLLQSGDLIRIGQGTVLRYEMKRPQRETRAFNVSGISADTLPQKRRKELVTGPFYDDLPEPSSGKHGQEEESVKDNQDSPPENAKSKPPEEPKPIVGNFVRPEPDARFVEDEALCILCGKTLPHGALEKTYDIQDMDFMCPDCAAMVQAERQAEAAAEAERAAAARKPAFKCASCGSDMSKMANQDGRAEELREITAYLCRVCADKSAGTKREQIADFLVLKKLGEGGMGIVYRAWHTPTGRVVALKQIRSAIQGEEIAYQRFLREMSIMQDLKHPNLVRLFSSGKEKGAPYFVSELVPDGNMDQFVTDQGKMLLNPQQAGKLIADALVGLEYLHQKGYVHRDLKPENILVQRLDGGWQPKLVDFGLSRSYEKHGGTVSRTGTAAGTIIYMPPEQITNFKRSRPPVDVYAMGVTLYFLLTGAYSLKFPGKAAMAAGRGYIDKDPVKMVLRDPPIPVREQRRDLPPALCKVVDKAVLKDASQRYQTAEALRQAILEAIT